ncbi:MAG TPA: hypothetical protein VN704_02115 [Verrucomicrobiae bacterium]|nr:hypothetical protein [Verrucomicrobiae bacterium]
MYCISKHEGSRALSKDKIKYWMSLLLIVAREARSNQLLYIVDAESSGQTYCRTKDSRLWIPQGKETWIQQFESAPGYSIFTSLKDKNIQK